MNPIKSDSYLYIVECNGKCKVGVSALPEQRVALIRTDNYQPVKTIAIVKLKNAYKVENELHDILTEAGRHVRGEWFEIEGSKLLESLEDIIGLDEEISQGDA